MAVELITTFSRHYGNVNIRRERERESCNFTVHLEINQHNKGTDGLYGWLAYEDVGRKREGCCGL